MDKNYMVVDEQGRLWAKTMTRLKAAKIVERLKVTKDLNCTIEPNKGA